MSSSHSTSRTHDIASREAGKRKRDEHDAGVSDERCTDAGKFLKFHRQLRAPLLRLPALDIGSATPSAAGSPLHSPVSSSGNNHHGGHGNGSSSSSRKAAAAASARVVQKRNIDRVQFGQYDIRTWYFSPYQFDEEEWASMATAAKDAEVADARGGVGESRNNKGARQSAAAIGPDSISSKPGGALSNSAENAPALHANGNHVQAAQEEPIAKGIWVCEGCFKYMRTYSGFRAHKKDCNLTHPPGRKVYQRGAHTIWEVDGAKEKLYAQNLSLFGKLFIDHKTIYFDVEPFTFYVLTDATSSFDHVLGYFSKEKVSYDDYNLACIITFPPFQKSGFGTLMIEFSYYLSGLTDVLGTPERPLSDLGLKGYLSFWSAVALRTLALFFNDQHPDIHSRLLPATITPQKGRHHLQTAEKNAALQIERQYAECQRIRRILLGKPYSKGHIDPSSSSPKRGDDQLKRATKGWAGEVPKQKNTERARSSSGSAMDTSFEMQSDDPILDPKSPIDSLETSLDRIAEATSLRNEDLCFALSDCGLLSRELASTIDSTNGHDRQSPLRLIITQDRVRDALKRLNVKRPVMDVKYVLL